MKASRSDICRWPRAPKCVQPPDRRRTPRWSSNPEVGPRLVELLDRCGIAVAHFASRGTADLKGLLSQQPERVGSLTVLCPAVLDTRTLARIGDLWKARALAAKP
jgi:hypothetical protein